MTKRSGLGRNLSALLSPSSNSIQALKVADNNSTMLSVSCLQSGQYQPRTVMDEASLQELTLSIKQQGLLQPILVRPLSDTHYEIIAGERRWRACQMAGFDTIPAIIRQVDNETAMAMALVENLQREDLNAVEQAKAIERLSKEFSLTHQEIATLLSKSRTAISNFVRLLSLPADVLRLLENGDLDMGHARALLSLDAEQLIPAAHLVVAQDLSVRETEKLVHRIKEGKTEEKSRDNPLSPHLQSYLEYLTSELQTKVAFKTKKSGKGALIIHYNSAQDLEILVNKISNHLQPA